MMPFDTSGLQTGLDELIAKNEERNRRFDWWKSSYLAALAGLANHGIPEESALDAAEMANHAGPYIAKAYDHFVVKGRIAPNKIKER